MSTGKLSLPVRPRATAKMRDAVMRRDADLSPAPAQPFEQKPVTMNNVNPEREKSTMNFIRTFPPEWQFSGGEDGPAFVAWEVFEGSGCIILL